MHLARGDDSDGALATFEQPNSWVGNRAQTCKATDIEIVLSEVVSSYRSPLHVDERSHIGAICTAIHRAPFDPQLTAGRLKASCGTHDNNVAIAFKLTVGYSIMGYVLSLRLLAAAACLERTDCTIAAIARRVGFSSLQRFYATFVPHFGETPACYARRHRAKGANESGVTNTARGKSLE